MWLESLLFNSFCSTQTHNDMGNLNFCFCHTLGVLKALVIAITIKVHQAPSSRPAAFTRLSNQSARQSASTADLNSLPILS